MDGLMSSCIFCEIASGTRECHRIWEDDEHLAFLSSRPNTAGFTVVITKRHHSSYAFDLPDEVLSRLVLAARQVGKLLDQRLEDVGRTGLIFEGFGVDHVHAKLFPMHGTGSMDEWHPIRSNVEKYFDSYEGYISSHDSKVWPAEKSAALAAKIRGD